MPKWIPANWHTVTPRIVVSDPAGLVRFLQNVFEARGEIAADKPAVMRVGDSTIMVSASGLRDESLGFFYVYVEDVDATYARAVAAMAEVLEEPSDVPYGDRRAMVRDPFGNTWQIATHVREIS